MSDDAFVQTLRRLMERVTDPTLHERIWDYREGLISKAELYRDSRFRQAMTAWYAEAAAQLRDEGYGPERVRERVVELHEPGKLEARD